MYMLYVEILKPTTSWIKASFFFLNVLIAFQEPILFSCSVGENIAYGATDPDSVTLHQIEEAARKANAYSFVKGFPEGFDTLVGERGLMLSGRVKYRWTSISINWETQH